MKCVDLYFTFRKLLHCITCGYKASSSTMTSLLIPPDFPFTSMSEYKKAFWPPNEDKYENIDYGPWTVSCLTERIYYFHIFENHIVFINESSGIIHNLRESRDGNFSCRIMIQSPDMKLIPEIFYMKTLHMKQCMTRSFSLSNQKVSRFQHNCHMARVSRSSSDNRSVLVENIN